MASLTFIPRCQDTWATWSRWLFMSSIYGHPMPRDWLHQEQEPTLFNAPSQLQLQQLGTHYLQTFVLVVPCQPSKDTSKPTCSDSLNLKPPAPLYPRTLGRYTKYKCCIIIFRPRHSRSTAAYSCQTFQWTICRSVQSSVEKRRIKSGCRLASYVGRV